MATPCANAHTPAEKRACQALGYRVVGNSWRVVARLIGYAGSQDAREAALAHLAREGDGVDMGVRDFPRRDSAA